MKFVHLVFSIRRMFDKVFDKTNSFGILTVNHPNNDLNNWNAIFYLYMSFDFLKKLLQVIIRHLITIISISRKFIERFIIQFYWMKFKETQRRKHMSDESIFIAEKKQLIFVIWSCGSIQFKLLLFNTFYWK